MTHATGREYCSADRCGRYFAAHRWGAHRAVQDGWFQQKNGQNWCPDHIPDWVAAWREGKNKFK